MMNKRLHIFVRGGVQGVSFRDFTEKSANILGIVGTAENIDSDKVEIVGEGYGAALTLWLEMIKNGPRGSNVVHESHEFEKPLTNFKDFRVIYPEPVYEPLPNYNGSVLASKFGNFKYDHRLNTWKQRKFPKIKIEYKLGHTCPKCNAPRDFRVEGAMLVCTHCGRWFKETEIIKVEKKGYIHQPDQYDKGSILRTDGNCMLHWHAMKDLGYHCTCEMCQRAEEIVIEAEQERTSRDAGKDKRKWI
jgi:acylphosphatase